MLKLLIVTIVLGIATSDDIEFKGGDKEFRKWLDTLYTKIQIDPTTMTRVLTRVENTIKKITDEVKTIEECFTFVQLKGSASEDLKVLHPDEFDFGLINNQWTTKIVLKEQAKTPGFAYAIGEEETCLDKYKVKTPENAIDPDAVRQHMAEIVQLALKKQEIPHGQVRVVGPAVSFNIESGEKTFPTIDIDLTLGINQKDWPDEARDLPDPLKDADVALVPKVIQEDPEVWQISFSAVEIKLFEDIDKDGGCRKKVLKLAKYLKIASTWPDTVTSYNLKTVLMQLDFDKPNKEDWSEDQLVNRFRDEINGILSALEKKNLPSFFVPTYNMFKDKPDLEPAVNAIKRLIATIWNDPDSLFPKSSTEEKSPKEEENTTDENSTDEKEKSPKGKGEEFTEGKNTSAKKKKSPTKSTSPKGGKASPKGGKKSPKGGKKSPKGNKVKRSGKNKAKPYLLRRFLFNDRPN